MKDPGSRLILLSFFVVISFSRVLGQIISDISHEPFRDKVLITYNLNGLAPQQRMEVNLYCSDDGFKDGLKVPAATGQEIM